MGKENKFTKPEEGAIEEPTEEEFDEGKEDEGEPKDPQVSVAEMQRRIKAEKEKYEALIQKQKEEHERERQKDKMTKDELEEHEAQEKDRKIADLEAQLNRTEMTAKAAKALGEAGFTIDDETMEFVVREDEEKTLEAVQSFTKLINDRVNERLKENARQEAPQKGGTGSTTPASFNVAEFARKNRLIKG